MSHRALVTGATGFLGGELVRRLLSDGNEVSVIVRPGSAKVRFDEGVADVHVHNGTTNSLIEIVSRCAPDVVYHLASCFIAEHQPEQIENLVSANIAFPTQLLEAMAMAGCHNLVNTGTSWQHFETQSYRPVNLYAATKQAFDDIVMFYADARGLSFVTLKLFDTYGPNDRRRKLLRLLQDAARSDLVLDMSPGEQRIDLVHSDDVIEAFVLAGQRLLRASCPLAESYLISGETLSLRDLVAMLDRSGLKVKVNWGAKPYRQREVMSPVKVGAHQLPGWSRRVALEEGLREMVHRSD